MSLPQADALLGRDGGDPAAAGVSNPEELVILDSFAEPLRNAGVRVVDRPFRDRTAEPDRALTEHRGE